MGTEKANKRDKFVGVWYTTSEYEQLTADMSSVNCLSVSKYIRMRTLNQQIKVQKFTYTDRALKKQINDLSKKISRIGNNINQFVKHYNGLAKSSRKNGDPVINTKATIFYIEKLRKELQELIDNHNKIVSFAERISIQEKDNPLNK